MRDGDKEPRIGNYIFVGSLEGLGILPSFPVRNASGRHPVPHFTLASAGPRFTEGQRAGTHPLMATDEVPSPWGLSMTMKSPVLTTGSSIDSIKVSSVTPSASASSLNRPHVNGRVAISTPSHFSSNVVLSSCIRPQWQAARQWQLQACPHSEALGNPLPAIPVSMLWRALQGFKSGKKPSSILFGQ